MIIETVRQLSVVDDPLHSRTHINASFDKPRFAFSQGRTQIRANQGHSISVDLNLSPKTPPGTLYHGTAVRFVEAI